MRGPGTGRLGHEQPVPVPAPARRRRTDRFGKDASRSPREGGAAAHTTKGPTGVSVTHHGVRIFLLMVGATCLCVWLNYHSEVSFADGLRSIEQAQMIDRGAWSEAVIGSVEHPLHPLSIAAVHRVM